MASLVCRSTNHTARFNAALLQSASPIRRKARCYSAKTNESEDSLSLSIRALMRSSAQPVAVITTLISKNGNHDISSAEHSHAHGATLSSFSTVSLDPPLLVFSLRTPSRMADALRLGSSSKGGANFVLNILSDNQKTEAKGFSRGIKSFPLSQDWDETIDRNLIDGQHPLAKAPFHPSKFATNNGGIAVPVLSESIGAFACSVVQVKSLRDLHKDDDTPNSAANESDRGSELFIAKIHGVESNIDDEDKARRLPMVYWDQQFKSIK